MVVAKETVEKPGVEEMAGRAVNASVLLINPRQSETPLLRVAAMAGAAMHIAARTDRPLKKPEHMSDELWRYCQQAPAPSTATRRDKIEAELATLLLRIRAGRDYSESTFFRAAYLFGQWMRDTQTWQQEDMQVHLPRLGPFAAQVIVEWISDKCRHCAGTGEQELLRGGRARRARLFETGRARLVTCRACNGSRIAQPDVHDRVEALAIAWPDYKAQGWLQQFGKARTWLNRIAGRINMPLRLQLER